MRVFGSKSLVGGLDRAFLPRRAGIRTLCGKWIRLNGALVGLPYGSLFSGSSPTVAILEEYDGCSVAGGSGLGQSSLLGQQAHAVGLSASGFSFCVKSC